MYRVFISIVIVIMLCCSCGVSVDNDKTEIGPTESSSVAASSSSESAENKKDVNDINNKLESRLVINEETIIELLSMDEKEFIYLLGDSYTLHDEETSNLVYKYNNYGIEITYNTDFKSIVQIFISDSQIELFGVNNSLKFSEIKSILGSGELIVNEDYGTYILLYKYDKYKIQFYAIDDPEQVENNGFNIRQPEGLN